MDVLGYVHTHPETNPHGLGAAGWLHLLLEPPELEEPDYSCPCLKIGQEVSPRYAQKSLQVSHDFLQVRVKLGVGGQKILCVIF